jgi:hypothetical protein
VHGVDVIHVLPAKFDTQRINLRRYEAEVAVGDLDREGLSGQKFSHTTHDQIASEREELLTVLE